jgi:hypothetical protein
VPWHVLEAGGEQVSFDATSDTQIQLRERSEQRKKRENPQGSFGQDVGSGVEMKERDSSKLDELCGNVYENKGPLLKTERKAGIL